MLGALLLTLESGSALAAQPDSLDLSFDIDWTAGAVRIADEYGVRLSLPSTVTVLDLGLLPRPADVTAYHLLDGNTRLIALDTPVNLGNGLYGPEDILAWDGNNFLLFFDGSSAGLSRGARIDAISRQRHAGVMTSMLLSFDVTVTLPGGLTAADEDIVEWDGASWSLFFDGSANGIPANLDVDGFDRDPVTGTHYYSFDTSGQIATVYFDDEDVVAFDGGAWSLAVDASASIAGTFAGVDLDALGVRALIVFRDGFESAPFSE